MDKFNFSLQRFASISNSNSNTVITSVDSSDTVSNSGNSVQIYLGSGNDSINNTGNFVTISGGSGDNYIYNNGGDNSIITSDSDKDTVNNYYGNNVYISTGGDADSIHNYDSNNLTIAAGDGDDTVTNDYGVALSVDLGNGDDRFINSGDNYSSTSYLTINGGAGSDTIYSDNYSLIYGGEGNDYIQAGTGSAISGGEGNNFIICTGDNTAVTTGGGNDSIRAYYNNNTITAGAGNDSIYLSSTGSGNVINYNYGDGDDTIANFNASDTLKISSTSGYNISQSGNNIYVTFDSGSLTLQNVGANVSDSNIVLNNSNSGRTYSGGNVTFTDYADSEQINYQTDFTGLGFNDTDFMVNSSTGTLTIQNARDKLMNFAVNGSTAAYALMSSGGGEINGGGFSVLTAFIGGNDASNVITAGSGGSSLWGGSGGYDTLTGGAGQDNFFFGKYDGADVINNASSSDVVNLYDISLSDIVSANVDGNLVAATFSSGGSLQIYSAENLSPTFRLTDGAWKYNQSTGQWQSA